MCTKHECLLSHTNRGQKLAHTQTLLWHLADREVIAHCKLPRRWLDMHNLMLKGSCGNHTTYSGEDATVVQRTFHRRRQHGDSSLQDTTDKSRPRWMQSPTATGSTYKLKITVHYAQHRHNKYTRSRPTVNHRLASATEDSRKDDALAVLNTMAGYWQRRDTVQLVELWWYGNVVTARRSRQASSKSSRNCPTIQLPLPYHPR